MSSRISPITGPITGARQRGRPAAPGRARHRGDRPSAQAASDQPLSEAEHPPSRWRQRLSRTPHCTSYLGAIAVCSAADRSRGFVRARTPPRNWHSCAQAPPPSVRPSVCPSAARPALPLTLYSAFARVTLAYLRPATRSGRKAREYSFCSTFVLRWRELAWELTILRIVHVNPLGFLPHSFRSVILSLSLFLFSSFSPWLNRRSRSRWWERDAWSSIANRRQKLLASAVASSSSRALRSLLRPESCARPPARGDVLFLSPPHSQKAVASRVEASVFD